MNFPEGWILIVGYGSIGRRHFQNLVTLGCPDVRLLRRSPRGPTSFETPAGTHVYTELAAALADCPAAVIVCNPTSLHVSTVRAALEVGASVLLEKPVDAELAVARVLLDEMPNYSGVVSMAYSFRYHPLYRTLREIVREGQLGRVFHLHTWQASYLPNWHPWEDYRTSYAARADLGGGVVRTLDHDLDFLYWTLGAPTEVCAMSGPLSGIEAEVEDTADMIFRFPGRVQAHAHLCFGRQDYARGVWVVGEKASALLDWHAGTLTLHTGREKQELLHLPSDFDLNQIYVDMLQEALKGFAESPPRAVVPLADGVVALEMACAALESSETGQRVALPRTSTSKGYSAGEGAK